MSHRHDAVDMRVAIMGTSLQISNLHVPSSRFYTLYLYRFFNIPDIGAVVYDQLNIVSISAIYALHLAISLEWHAT